MARFRQPLSRKTRRACLTGAALFLCLALQTGCQAVGLPSRATVADQIADSGGLIKIPVKAAPFALTAFARIGDSRLPADLYIEGDGFAWLDRHTPSGDPTPKNPVGLRLAATDSGRNVIYLARPCQYGGMINGRVCATRYWTDARLAPEVILSLDRAIDQLKAQTHVSSFNLVGFSGGGGAALLLAARRHDVASIRTVAGNLDAALFSQIHHVSPMTGSIDPMSAALSDASIPQIHFVGADDKTVPVDLAKSFRRASGSPRCLAVKVVDNASHDDSWVVLWPRLLQQPLPCPIGQ